jgi:hypothetical protein
MGTWYKVMFPASETGVGGKAVSMQDVFEKLFITNAAPADAAVFTNHDESFDNHYYYFSPGAARIAYGLIQAYSGNECSAPLRGEVNLVVGHSQAPELLLRGPDNS